VIQFGPRLGTVGKIALSVFFLAYSAFALLMLGLLVLQTVRTAQTFWWKPVQCTILESRVIEPGHDTDSYAVAISYRYSWQGQEYTSDRVTWSGKTWSHYGAAARYAAGYAVGSQATCYVNPAAPAEAVLEREGLWFAFIAGLMLLVFVAIGLVGLWAIWRKQPDQAKAAAGPISAQRSQALATGFIGVFCALFLVVGVGLFYALFLRPVGRVLEAQRWQETPCVILSSRVRTHHGGNGRPTYSVEVLYSYVVNGVEYKSSRYSFTHWSSSGRESKVAAARRYQPGAQAVCYVNLADPTDAVLVRDFTGEMWLGLFPLVFVVFGGGGLVWVLRRRGAKPSTRPVVGAPILIKALDSRAGPLQPPAGPLVLRSTGSRLGKFAGSVLIAGFWNGILAVFLVEAIQSFQRGQPEWFLAIFLIPFVIVGVLLLGHVGYSLLLLFAPGVKLRLSAAAVPLGGSAELEWEITGRATALRKLRLWLEGREEAIYPSGKNTSTDRATFATIELAAPTLWTDIRHGQVRFTVPADTMHSFKADHNRITWVLRVHGDIAFYPDVDDEFPFTVLPLSPAQAAVS
jgi:hypothetical protein